MERYIEIYCDRKESDNMVYSFMTLEDNTEIVHSQELDNGEVKVYVETPDEKDCFHHMTCYLPQYRLEDVFGYTDKEIEYYMDIIKSTAHLIMEFARQGGFENRFPMLQKYG